MARDYYLTTNAADASLHPNTPAAGVGSQVL